MSRTNVISTAIKVIQIPSKDNNFTGIVSTETKSPNGTFQVFGVATAETSNSKDVKTILENAKQDSHDNLGKLTFSAIAHEEQNQSFYQEKPQSNTGGFSSSVNKSSNGKVYNHNPNNPASDGQINYLFKLKSKSELEQAAQELFGKSLNDINSPDADALIKKFMPKRSNYAE